MAALDYNAVLLAAIKSALFANSALADGCKVGSRIFEQDDDSAVRGAHKRAPGDYLEIRGESASTNETQAMTVTPTLGLGRAVNADAIVPVTCAFDLTLTYDPLVWPKKHPAAGRPEVEARAALMAGYPRLGGLTFIRSLRVEQRRGKVSTSTATGVASGGKVQVICRVIFELRLHAAQLRN